VLAGVGTDFVVAAPQVLGKGVPGDDDERGLIRFQAVWAPETLSCLVMLRSSTRE
jgi:hypothetical protein